MLCHCLAALSGRFHRRSPRLHRGTRRPPPPSSISLHALWIVAKFHRTKAAHQVCPVSRDDDGENFNAVRIFLVSSPCRRVASSSRHQIRLEYQNRSCYLFSSLPPRHVFIFIYSTVTSSDFSYLVWKKISCWKENIL